MKKIKTYRFVWCYNYNNEYDSTEFCAFNKKEAKELFEHFVKENGDFGYTELKCEIVFEQSDKDEYGDDYWM